MYPLKKGVHLKERILGANYFLQKFTPIKKRGKNEKGRATFRDSVHNIHLIKVQGIKLSNCMLIIRGVFEQ